MRASVLAFVTLVGCAAVSVKPVKGEQMPPAPFAEEIHVFGMEDEIFPPEQCSTLFVGSSSIRFWFRLSSDFPGDHVIRRGFGGATIADINRYFDRVVERYHPSRIVFYAGENDLNAGGTIDEVVGAFRKFLDKKDAALGATPIYYVSVKPSVARMDEFGLQEMLNQRISSMAEARADLTFIDIVTPMMKDGVIEPELYISDRLHMNERGYDIWRVEIHDALESRITTTSPYCP